MTETLSSIIKTLKHTSRLLEGTDIPEILTKLDELSEDDRTKAFFLGQLLRSRSNSFTPNSSTIKRLHEYIIDNNLTNYFNQQDIPGSKNSWSDGLFVLVGTLFVAGGVFQFSKNIITVGFDSRYHLLHVNGGGYTIIFGLILLTIGVLRLKYLNKQSQLLKKITDQNSN